MAGSWTAFAVLRVLQIRKSAGKCCCSLNELTCHPLWHTQHPKSLQSPFSSFDSQTVHCSNPNPAIKPQNCHSFLYPWQSVALNFKQKASSHPPFLPICALRINLCNEVIGLIWTMTDFPMARFLNSAENAWHCCPSKELFKQGVQLHAQSLLFGSALRYLQGHLSTCAKQTLFFISQWYHLCTTADIGSTFVVHRNRSVHGNMPYKCNPFLFFRHFHMKIHFVV